MNLNAMTIKSKLALWKEKDRISGYPILSIDCNFQLREAVERQEILDCLAQLLFREVLIELRRQFGTTRIERLVRCGAPELLIEGEIAALERSATAFDGDELEPDWWPESSSGFDLDLLLEDATLIQLPIIDCSDVPAAYNWSPRHDPALHCLFFRELKKRYNAEIVALSENTVILYAKALPLTKARAQMLSWQLWNYCDGLWPQFEHIEVLGAALMTNHYWVLSWQDR